VTGFTEQELAEALEGFLDSPRESHCACEAFREQFFAWIVGEPAPEVMQVTDAPCAICHVIHSAVLSVITPDALLLLANQCTQGNPLALTLTHFLPNTPISWSVQ
jgi:hypothetical protein